MDAVPLLDLDEVLADSPAFHEKLNSMEHDLEDFSSSIRKLLKNAKNQGATGAAHVGAGHLFADALINFPVRRLEGEARPMVLGEAMLQFAQSLKELEVCRDMLLKKMDILLVKPLEYFVRVDVHEIKESKKTYERAQQDYNSVLQKFNAMSSRTDTARRADVERDLQAQRRSYQLASSDLATGLNEIHSKKKFELLEALCAFMQAQLGYYHQGYECLKDLEPYVQDLVQHIQGERSKFEATQTANTEHRRALETAEHPAAAVDEPAEAPGIKPPTTTRIEKEGYMYKRSSKIAMKEWKRRWFVVKNGKLYYYRTWKDPNPQGVINLLLATVKQARETDKLYVIEIIAAERTYVLQAENMADMLDWVAVIQNAIASQLQVGSAHVDTGGPLQALHAECPENTVCADCGHPDPDWVSINLGVLICIECSGIHRSLGVHISKVRSLTLDKTDPVLLEVLCAIGNKTANAILESGDVSKPAPTATRAAKEAWIRAKYQDRLFALPDQLTPEKRSVALANACAADDVAACFRILASHDVDINWSNPDDHGKRPLHVAAYTGSTRCLELLLNNDALVDAQDDNGWTALHYAALKKLSDVITVLVRHKANLSIADASGSIPHDLAAVDNHQKCMALLDPQSTQSAQQPDDPGPPDAGGGGGGGGGGGPAVGSAKEASNGALTPSVSPALTPVHMDQPLVDAPEPGNGSKRPSAGGRFKAFRQMFSHDPASAPGSTRERERDAGLAPPPTGSRHRSFSGNDAIQNMPSIREAMGGSATPQPGATTPGLVDRPPIPPRLSKKP